MSMETTVKLQTRKPYVAPLLEVDEYVAEAGFATTKGFEGVELTEVTNDDGDNVQGGYYFDAL